MPHLYRKSGVCVTVLVLVVFLSVSFFRAEAQRPEMRRPGSDDSTQQPPASSKKAKRAARAIAVVEMLPSGGTRLVPIALWMDGKYYDASLYGANPVPLAVQPGTVYEAQNYGQVAGTFVVSMPKLVGGTWAADGQWKPYSALDVKIAEEAAKHPQPKAKESKAIFTGGPDEGPPVLKRAGDSNATQQAETSSSSKQAPAAGQSGSQAQSASTANSGGSAGSSSAPPAANDGRPTLRRPGDSDTDTNTQPAAQSGTVTVQDPNRPVLTRPANSSGQASSGQASVSADDPDRPVYHRQAAPAAAPEAASSTPNPASNDNDPDRPMLSRGGKPEVQTIQPAKSTTAPSAKKPAPGTALHSYPAISDTGKYETRPLLYVTSPEQMQQLSKTLLGMALAEMRTFAAKRPGPQIPKTAAITDYDFRGFDLDFSNSATLVLTAKLPVTSPNSRPFAYYATVVARVDINGEPQKVFSSVTDTVHLDAYPRLELIDALDADANGRGDLLFRQYSDVGSNYGLYRVFPYNMEKIFEGGSGL